MRRARGRLGLAALAAVFTSACDSSGPCGKEANKLTGSVSELYPIESSRVRARKVGEDGVTVEFLEGNDIVTKLAVDVRSFAKGSKIPLTDGTVYRVTADQRDFPNSIETGSVTFESDLVVGGEVSGCFDVLFELQDGSKRTLGGAFEATLEAAGGL